MRFFSLFVVLTLCRAAAITPAIAQAHQDGVSNQAASVPLAPKFYEPSRVTGIAQRLEGISTRARGEAARLLDSGPGDEILVLEGHTTAVNAVAFSPDGARIATGSDDNTAIVWDAGTGEQAHLLAEHSGAVNAVFFSPSGNTTWTGSSDAKVIIWNTSGESTWTGEYPRAVSSVALSPDGTKMLVGTGTSLLAIPPRPSVYLYDLEQGGQPIHVLGPEGNDGFYTSVAYSPTQDKVLTSLAGVWSGHSRIWDAESGDLLFSLDVGRVTSAVFSPDGTQALTGSGSAANLWDVETGELVREFRGHGGAVTSVAFSPDGTVALTGSADRTARLWDVATGEHLLTFSGHIEAVNAVAFSPDGSTVLTGSEDETARLWDSGIQGTGTSPAAPEGLTATPGNGEVTLTWNASTESDLASYLIYRGTDPAPTTPVDSVEASMTSYTDTGLVNGTTYYYRLKAVDGEGNASDFSEEVSATPISGATHGVISGTVLDVGLAGAGRLEEVPLAGAAVALYQGGELLKRTTTEADGSFTFEDLEDRSTYEVYAEAEGVVPETDEAVPARRIEQGVAAGENPRLVLPISLATAKYSLIYALEHLEIKSELLFEFGPIKSIPSFRSYDETGVRGLLREWLNDGGGDAEQVVEALGRLVLAEQVMQDLFGNAAEMSHETATSLAEVGFAIATVYLLKGKVDKALRAGKISTLAAELANSLLDLAIDHLNSPVRRFVARLPDQEGQQLVSAFRALREAALAEAGKRGDAFMTSLGQDQLKSFVVIVFDEVLLADYVSATQKHIGFIASHSSAFNFSGRHVEANVAAKAVVIRNDRDTETAKAWAEARQEVGSVSGTLGDVAALTGTAVLGTQPLLKVAAALKALEITLLIEAAVRTGLQYAHTQRDDVPLAVARAFHPEASVNRVAAAKPSYNAAATYSPERLATYQTALDGVIEAYLDLLARVVSQAEAGQRSDALAEAERLLDLEVQLSEALLIAHAPVLAAAEQALETRDGFGTAYSRLEEAMEAATLKRIDLYAELLAYEGNPSAPADSVVTQAMAVEEALMEAQEAIGSAIELIADANVPGFLIVRRYRVETSEVAPNQPFAIQATVQNAGAARVEDVVATLQSDSTVTVAEPTAIALGAMEPGTEKTITWQLTASDTSRSFGSYFIGIEVLGAKALPASGTYAVVANRKATPSEAQAELPVEYVLQQNYPNPFNPATTIVYNVPDPSDVRVLVYNLLGKTVAVLVDEHHAAGRYETVFDASGLASGVYLYTLRAGSFTQTKRLVLLK